MYEYENENMFISKVFLLEKKRFSHFIEKSILSVCILEASRFVGLC